ncbi:MAG: type IV pilin protein [Candidatus Reddybacter sp.]
MISRKARGCRRSLGFTLIELMIVIAIVAILAAVAYPSYLNSIRTARRADAMDAVLTLQNLQEKWRASNTTYGTLAEIGGDAASTDGHYTIGVSGNTATAYVLTATPTGSQAADTRCATMTLTVSAGSPRGVKDGTSGDCWKN